MQMSYNKNLTEAIPSGEDDIMCDDFTVFIIGKKTLVCQGN